MRINGPIDVPQVNVSNEYRPVQRDLNAALSTSRALTATANSVQQIVDAAHDQQIDSQVLTDSAELNQRLIELRTEIENDQPPEGGGISAHDWASQMPERWQTRANQIAEEITQRRGRSALYNRRWQERTTGMLSAARENIHESAQARVVDLARGEYLTAIGTLREQATNADLPADVRTAAQVEAERHISQAVLNRTITAAYGAEQLNSFRSDVREFQRVEGLRQQATNELDRIWAEAGGNYSVALGMIEDVTDARMRDELGDRAAQRHAREEEGRRTATADAMGRAYQHIEENGSLDGFQSSNRDDYELLTEQGQLDTLRSYAQSRVSGGGVEASNRISRARHDVLMRLADEPETAAAFAEIDLFAPLDEEQARVLGMTPGQSIADQVQNPADLRDLRQRQREMTGQEPISENQMISQRAYSLLWTAAEASAPLGLGLSGRREDAERVRALQTFLHAEARAFTETQRRLPNEREQQEIVALAYAQARTGGGVFGLGRQERRVFEAREGAQVRVGISRIPEYRRSQLRRAFINSGDPATRQREWNAMSEAQRITLIENMYQQELARE